MLNLVIYSYSNIFPQYALWLEVNETILRWTRPICTVPEWFLWRWERLGREVSDLLVILASIYSWSYESSCKSCSTMEQVFCHFLLSGDLLGPIILLLACCQRGMASFLFLQSLKSKSIFWFNENETQAICYYINPFESSDSTNFISELKSLVPVCHLSKKKKKRKT